MKDRLEIKPLSFDEHPWPDVPHMILFPSENSDRACLEALLEVCVGDGDRDGEGDADGDDSEELDSCELTTLFSSHPDIDEDEPWFGWAFQRGGSLQSERALFEAAAAEPALRGLLDIYVQRVIRYFKRTQGEPGFYVHEEKEAGSDAILFLVRADPGTYFDRYLEYLQAIDLEHTVAQHDSVRLIADVLDDAQRERLRAVLAEQSGGESFPPIE